MVSCNDCLHIDVCETRTCYMCDGGGFKCDDCEIYSNYGGKIPSIKNCKYFKDRTRFVELPCRVGSIVYIIPTTGNRLKEITKAKCISFSIGGVLNTSNLLFCGTSKTYFAGFDRFGKSIFLTREEAEQALKERENNG